MNDLLTLASERLLSPAGLDHSNLNRLLSSLLGPQIDNADIYFQKSLFESWLLEDGIVKEGGFNLDGGVGVRAISGEKTGFAYSNQIILPALEQAVQAARSIALSGQNQRVQAWHKAPDLALYEPKNPMDSILPETKVTFLKALDKRARAADPRVKEVTISLAASYETVLVAATDGTLASDIRPLVRLSVGVIVEQDGRRERGNFGGGGRFGFDQFINQPAKAQAYVDEAVRQALVNLEAKQAPAGSMPVVLAPGWSGVLLHEAVGHGLEGDFNRKGSSAYSGCMGQQVASKHCTIVDDATLDGRRGSLNMDDEGVAGQSTLLIEKGVLKGYMQDKLNARLMGVTSTGNGRRESYSYLPLPRMTNTYMLPGEFAPEEIIQSVKRGVYIAHLGGGQVDITSGKFVFSATEAYLIENGKKTVPIKGVTLIGNGPEAMNKVSMVGNDLQLDSGVGVCGKEGQSLPVGVGQPTVKLDALTVGGTAS